MLLNFKELLRSLGSDIDRFLNVIRRDLNGPLDTERKMIEN